MTRTHFRQLAEALRTTGASHDTVLQVALVCARSNPNFDWDKFREACNSCYLSEEAYTEMIDLVVLLALFLFIYLIQ